jgi:GNAT superfamily N-acetyltransferase
MTRSDGATPCSWPASTNESADFFGDSGSGDEAGVLVIRRFDLRDEAQVAGLFDGEDRKEFRDQVDLARGNLALTGGRPFETPSWTAAAYCNQQLVGLVVLTDLPQSDRSEVRLIVDARWRRRGIASTLIRRATAWASSQQKSALRITCSRKDWPMRSFLKKTGARLDLAFGEIVAHVPLGRQPRATGQQTCRAAARHQEGG